MQITCYARKQLPFVRLNANGIWVWFSKVSILSERNAHKFRLSGSNFQVSGKSYVCVSHLKCSYVCFLMATDSESQFFIKFLPFIVVIIAIAVVDDIFNCFAP